MSKQSEQYRARTVRAHIVDCQRAGTETEMLRRYARSVSYHPTAAVVDGLRDRQYLSAIVYGMEKGDLFAIGPTDGDRPRDWAGVRMYWIEHESPKGADLVDLRVDLVFLDCRDRTDRIEPLIEAWLPHLAPGAMLCGNCLDEVKHVVDRIAPLDFVGPGSLWGSVHPSRKVVLNHAPFRPAVLWHKGKPVKG